MATYIATEALFIGNTRAHNPGDFVPEENVARNGWGDMVSRQGTKAAEKAVAEAADEAAPLSTSAQSPNKK